MTRFLALIKALMVPSHREHFKSDFVLQNQISGKVQLVPKLFVNLLLSLCFQHSQQGRLHELSKWLECLVPHPSVNCCLLCRRRLKGMTWFRKASCLKPTIVFYCSWIHRYHNDLCKYQLKRKIPRAFHEDK